MRAVHSVTRIYHVDGYGFLLFVGQTFSLLHFNLWYSDTLNFRLLRGFYSFINELFMPYSYSYFILNTHTDQLMLIVLYSCFVFPPSFNPHILHSLVLIPTKIKCSHLCCHGYLSIYPFYLYLFFLIFCGFSVLLITVHNVHST